MTKSLRERQKKIARETILTAIAEEVSESGSFDFSINDIAERAGVSHRTVYNYYASRQDLIDAFSEWTDRKVHEEGGVVVPERLEDLAHAVMTNFHIFEQHSGAAEVLAREVGADVSTAERSRRTEGFVAAVTSSYPEMDDEQRRAVAALLRQLASVRTWYYMTREHGLSTDGAACVSAWAIDQLRASLDRGELPDLDLSVVSTN